jgi:hypothetical protein
VTRHTSTRSDDVFEQWLWQQDTLFQLSHTPRRPSPGVLQAARCLAILIIAVVVIGLPPLLRAVGTT